MRVFVFALAITLTISANADSRYDNYSRAQIMAKSTEMATCAGRHEAAAEMYERIDRSSTAELQRRLGVGFRQCAVYMRMKGSARSVSSDAERDGIFRDIEKSIDREKDLARLLLGSEFESDDFYQAGRDMDECKVLADEALGCIQEVNAITAAAGKSDQQDTGNQR